MDKEPMSQQERALRMRLDGYTFGQIGKRLQVSRQRAAQILTPPPAVRTIVRRRAADACQACGLLVGEGGHVHHRRSIGPTCDAHNDLDNLELLCISCHRLAHAGIIKQPVGAPPRWTVPKELEQLGVRLRKHRKGRGLNQETIAELVGVSRAYISQLENGVKASPSRRVLEKLARVFGLTVSQLIEEENGPT